MHLADPEMDAREALPIAARSVTGIGQIPRQGLGLGESREVALGIIGDPGHVDEFDERIDALASGGLAIR